jgi:UDP-N-acetylglucosamine:LPS N-acetylglucosamine transferase
MKKLCHPKLCHPWIAAFCCVITLFLFLTNFSLFAGHNLYKGKRSLRTKMAKKMPDVVRVDKILSELKKLSRKAKLSKRKTKALGNWLHTQSIFVGSSYYNHSRAFSSVKKLARNKKFKKQYAKFVENISQNPKVLPRAPHEKKHVSILYTGCYGGGHKTPATAIAQYFEGIGCEVQLIDVDVIANKYSPVVEGYTRAQIYGEVFQKEGNVEKAKRLKAKIEKAQTISSLRHVADIREMVREFNPKHIFVVAHHRPYLGAISYQLGIPMTFVHTDFIFHKGLAPLVKEQAKIKKPLITFSVLTRKKFFFKHLYEALDMDAETKTKLPASVRRQLLYGFGIPVRSSFVPPTPEQIVELRHLIGVPKEAIICKIAMGQNALLRETHAVIQRFIDEQKQLDKEVHLFVVCGKNDQLRESIYELTDQVDPNGKLKIHPFGFLNEPEMACVDKVSDIWISKPGGSTTSELVATQKQMLYLTNPHHHWELYNARFLQSHGLAEALTDDEPIYSQVKKRIKAHAQLDKNILPINEWKEKALSLVYAL